MTNEGENYFPEMTAERFEELAHMLNQGPDVEGYEEICQELQRFKSTLEPLDILPPIIQSSESACARMLILTIFREIISVFWDTISQEQKTFLQNFFFESTSTVAFCPDNEPEGASHIMCLIEILKKVWPQNWPTFTITIIQKSKSEGGAPINVAKLFMFLFEEIKDTIKLGITLSRHAELEAALEKDTPAITGFICDILSQATDPNLILAGLETFSTMLKWVEPVAFQNQVLITSIQNIFTDDQMKTGVLNCFAVIPVATEQSLSMGKGVESVYLFLAMLLSNWITGDFNFPQFCEENESAAHSLTLCLTEFLSYNNFKIMEYSIFSNPPIIEPIQYLVSLFECSTGPSYELCLEFWEKVAQRICFDTSAFVLPDEMIVSLMSILSDRIVPPSDFPFDETERGEEEYAICESLFSKLAQLLPAEAARITKTAIQSSSGLKLFCDAYAFGAIAYALPQEIENEVAQEVISFLLERAKESQEHAIAVIIVSKAHIKFLTKTPELLSSLIKQHIEWASSSSENPAFQLFCTQAIDKIFSAIPNDSLANGAIEVFHVAKEFALMVSPDCHPPFFHAISSVLKITPEKVGETSKSDLVQEVLQFPIQQWQEVCAAADSIDSSIFVASAHTIERIIEVNDPFIRELVHEFVSCAVHTLGSIPADDQHNNCCIRDALFDIFTTVVKVCSPEFASEVVSAIVEDYKSCSLEGINAKALDCFAHFVRRGVNMELAIQLSNEIIITTAENIIEYGDEIPSVEVGIFELISAIVSCASALEDFDPTIIEPLEHVIEWGLGRNSNMTVGAAISCIIMIVNSFDTPFSATFLEQYFMQLIKAMIEAMMHPLDNLIFNSFCHVIQKMMTLQRTLEADQEQIVAELIEIINGIAMCAEGDQSSIQDFAVAIVYEADNFSKLQISLAGLISQLRTIAFRNENQREQFNLEGGFLLSTLTIAGNTIEEL
jgi:exportin-1